MRILLLFWRAATDPRLFTAIGFMLVAVAAAGLITSGTCVWYYESDCDDEYDDDCDDDDDFDRPEFRTLKLAPPAAGWSLKRYRRENALAGGREQLTRLYEIEGLSLRDLKPVGKFTAEELRAFCRHVLRANAELIGLPESRGFLVGKDVIFDRDAIRVFFQQCEELEEGTPFELEGCGLIFTLDTRGVLREIEVATWLGPR